MTTKEKVIRYLEGLATKTEKAELLQWIRNRENRIVYRDIKLDWEKSRKLASFSKGEEESWIRLQARLWQKSVDGWQKTRRIDTFFKYAAIFFFILSLGGSIWFFSGQTLSSAETFASVIADKGQVSRVELPDGSMVWLNSGSKITYSNLFGQKNRTIQLDGEAYLDVTKNPDLPLVVKSNQLLVRVLGTKFNVSAYHWNETVEVVLEEGSVELINPTTENTFYRMRPGERAVLEGKRMTLSNVNTSKYTSWKEGMIHVYDQSMEELIKRLEFRYNQKFELAPETKSFKYTFTIQNEKLDEILHLMEKITPIKAIQTDSTIMITIDQKKMKKVE